jgi:hypothetical protein
VCQAPLKKPGDACTLAGQDVLCSSGFCGTDSKCTSECNTYDSALGRYTGCPTGFYCDVAQSTPGGYACEPLVANAAPCGVDGSSGHHDTCSSGFCNGSQCAAKVAADAACPSNADQECPSTQFCDISLATHICVTLIAKDAACTTAQGDHACGATATGNYCYYNGTAYLCRVPGDEDASCVLSGRDCKPTLTCTSDNKCHAQGKYPDGVNCQGSQTACASSWCSGNGATATPYVCKSPIADGDDCDTTDTTKNRCSDASYCKFAAGEHAGKCTAKGSAGQACEPRFNGVDCLSHFSLPTAHPPSPGMCSLKSDSFVCDSTATASDQVMCHGK